MTIINQSINTIINKIPWKSERWWEWMNEWKGREGEWLNGWQEWLNDYRMAEWLTNSLTMNSNISYLNRTFSIESNPKSNNYTFHWFRCEQLHVKEWTIAVEMDYVLAKIIAVARLAGLDLLVRLVRMNEMDDHSTMIINQQCHHPSPPWLIPWLLPHQPKRWGNDNTNHND